MLETIRKLTAFLDPRSRIQVGLLFFPMLAIALLEMVSIGLILPVIQVLFLKETGGAWTEALLKVLPELPTDQAAVWLTGVFAAFFIIKNLLLLAQIYIINKVIYAKAAEFSERMYAIYLLRPLTFHFGRNSAEAIRDLIGGIGLTFGAMRLALLLVLDLLLMLAASVVLVAIEPIITLCVLITLGALGFAFHYLAAPMFRYWGERDMAIEGDLIRWIKQSHSSIRELKLLHAFDYMRGEYGKQVMTRAVFQSRAGTSIQIPRTLVESVVVVGFLMLVLLLISLGRTPDEIFSMMAIYGMAALRLMPSMNRILTSAAELRGRTAFVDRHYADLMEAAAEHVLETPSDSGQPLAFNRDIRLEGTTYTYPDAEHHALNGITTTIKRGQSVGFVGPSGGGKSTLIDILLGLLRPQSGRLLIDGVDAFANLAAWQRRIGYVPQEISLIDDTFRRNIAFAMDDKDIDEARLAEVVRLARLEAVVEELPQGLSTVLGEGGTRLSGGQRQRVAIARALYRDPDVLVFDEATSALDSETEHEISLAIETLSGKRTVLIITHRLNTVRNCDMLVFLKDGRIAGTGTFDELIATNAEFRRLAEASGAHVASPREPRATPH